MSQVLLAEDRGPLRLLTLNRPDKRNALTIELLEALHAALATANGDEAVRAVAITGAGPSFCAGLDLREVQALRRDPGKSRLSGDRLYETLNLINRGPKPVIAAVNGPAVAGGAGLMSVCDLVIAAEAAKIGYPEVKRGLVAAIVMTYLIRQVGERRAKFLLLTGELLSAEQAVQLGLVNEAVPAEQMLSRVDYWAGVYAGCTAEALAYTKEMLYQVQRLGAEQAVEYVRKAHAHMRAAGSAEGAITDFLNEKS